MEVKKRGVTVQPKQILDRDLSSAISKETRSYGRPALQEVVDEGIRVFERCSATSKGTDEHIGLLFPFLHLVELLDAAEVALDSASVTGANLALRAAFEGLAALEWISRDRSLNYAAAYVVADIHRRIAGHERFLTGHEANKKLVSILKNAPSGEEIKIPVPLDTAERIAGLKALLTQPHLAKAEAEYQRTKSFTKRTPKFYALWNGPRDLERLSAEIGRLAQYEILYRSWSSIQHTTDVQRQLGNVDGTPAVRAFRSGDGLPTAYVFALIFGVSGIRALLEFYRPDELGKAFGQWYEKHITKAVEILSAAE